MISLGVSNNFITSQYFSASNFTWNKNIATKKKMVLYQCRGVIKGLQLEEGLKNKYN